MRSCYIRVSTPRAYAMALKYLALAVAAATVTAHDPSAVPFVAVPGYVDCSQGDPASPDFDGVRPCRGSPPAAGAVTIACVGDSITAGGWPQIMQTNLNTK